MPRVGVEPTIPVFEWAKTVHVLNRAATVISVKIYTAGAKLMCGGLAQLMQRRTTGWTAGVSIHGRGKRFSLLHSDQTLSGVHPASYPKGIEGKAAGK
jgi:hypothetical protein